MHICSRSVFNTELQGLKIHGPTGQGDGRRMRRRLARLTPTYLPRVVGFGAIGEAGKDLDLSIEG
jgi:hypothetical protein